MADSHLYVIQNHLGLIKIGKTAKVQSRFWRIASDDLCEVFPVAIIEGAGWSEQFAHRILAKHNLIGEWYNGSDRARRAIVRNIPLRRDTIWPVALAATDAVEEWLDRVEARRETISHEKLYLRLINDLIYANQHSLTGNDHHHNFKILEALERYEGVPSEENCGRFDHALRNTMPPFVSEIEVAMTLWPNDARPPLWEGNALECCIAALKLRRSRWMMLVRSSSEET